jgi:hypothetical protein
LSSSQKPRTGYIRCQRERFPLMRPWRPTPIFISINPAGHLISTNLESLYKETFEKCPILFKAKEGENFNHRNTLSILRIKI